MKTRDCVGCALVLLLAGCGGGGSPAAPGGTETVTFSGTAASTSASSCTGDTHSFPAGEGTVSVTLVETSTQHPMSAQICENGVGSSTCTLVRTRIEIAQTLNAPRKGGRNQVLSMLPGSCGIPGAMPEPMVGYTVRVSYPK